MYGGMLERLANYLRSAHSCFFYCKLLLIITIFPSSVGKISSLVMADADLVIVNLPDGSVIKIPTGTSARVALDALRYHPRAGLGVLSNRHNVLVVPSEAILQAADGPYLFEAPGG